MHDSPTKYDDPVNVLLLGGWLKDPQTGTGFVGAQPLVYIGGSRLTRLRIGHIFDTASDFLKFHRCGVHHPSRRRRQHSTCCRTHPRWKAKYRLKVTSSPTHAGPETLAVHTDMTGQDPLLTHKGRISAGSRPPDLVVLLGDLMHPSLPQITRN
jgi:hypothetical protein